MTPKLIQQVHGEAGAKRCAIRMKRLLEKVPFRRSTVYAKRNPSSRYFDSTFPKAFYAPTCRFPLWWEDEVDAWLVAAETTFRAVGHVALPHQAERKRGGKSKLGAPVKGTTNVEGHPGAWTIGGRSFADV